MFDDLWNDIQTDLMGNTLTLTRVGDHWQVDSSQVKFLYRPILELPRVLTEKYLDLQSSDGPGLAATSLLRMHIVEELTTDHGGGFNAVKSLGVRSGREGVPEFFTEIGEIPSVETLPEDFLGEWRK